MVAEEPVWKPDPGSGTDGDDDDDDVDDPSPMWLVAGVIWLVVLALNAITWANQPPLLHFLLLLLPAVAALGFFVRYLRGGIPTRYTEAVPGSEFDRPDT